MLNCGLRQCIGELWFTSVYWPEFKKKHLEEALSDYAKRERRFGGLIE
ncbi:MAG: undecaprenyl diphosphate synthase family protein [Planctomycetota bacterium]